MDWSILTPILTFIGGGLMTFTAHRLLDKVRRVDRETTLQHSLFLLQEEHATLQQTILDLRNENSDLKNRLAEHEDRKRILARYTFDESTSTYTNETEHRFCSKCLLKANPAESPLKTTKHGWQCPVCDAIFNDPNTPPPPMVFHQNSHEQSG